MVRRAVKESDMTKQTSCHPASRIQYPVSSIEYRESSITLLIMAYCQSQIANEKPPSRKCDGLHLEWPDFFVKFAV